MSVNPTAWLFISEAERVIAEYLEPLLADNVVAQPALTTKNIQTPSIAVRNTSVRPYTQLSAIVAHVETTTAVTVRTAYDEDMEDAGRANHTELVAHVMGCLMQIDGTTGENALPALLNAVAGDAVEFSMAAWSGTFPGIDVEARHFVTRIEIETLIHPKQAEPEEE